MLADAVPESMGSVQVNMEVTEMNIVRVLREWRAGKNQNGKRANVREGEKIGQLTYCTFPR